MSEQKIQLQHPQNKHASLIDHDKYDMMRNAILRILKGRELTHSELFREINQELAGKFEGNINWYAESVKLDLEAKKVIERSTTKPPKYKLKA